MRPNSTFSLLAALLAVVGTVISSCNLLPMRAPDAVRVEVTGGKAERPERLPLWNVWVQAQSDGQPVLPNQERAQKQLGTNENFSLIVELSGALYSRVVASKPISAELASALSNTSKAAVVLQIVAVPDRRHLYQSGPLPQVATLAVDLAKYRSLMARDQVTLTTDPAGSAPASMSDYNLGRAVFQFATRSATGLTNIALSVWIDNRPIDEMSIPICIGPNDECKRTWSPLASAGTLGQAFVQSPEASLHLLELTEDRLVGVFYCSSCQEVGGRSGYYTWDLANSADSLSRAIRTEVVPALEAAASVPRADQRQDAFRQAGRILYRAVFDSIDGVDKPHLAERAFANFVARARNNTLAPPLLYTRVIADESSAILLPLNNMLVPLPEGREQFLGYSVNTESFLPQSPIAPPPVCISRWALLVPDNRPGDPLHNARLPVDEIIPIFQKLDAKSVYEPGRLKDFRDWLDAEEKESGGIAVVTLTHHYENKLCFTSKTCDDERTIYASNVRRKFQAPSVVVLNGCGTGGQGATAFVEKFGLRGVSSIIATSVQVNEEMAGTFLKLLFAELTQHKNDTDYTISRARFDSVRRLSDETNANGTRFGPAALGYMLVGHGVVRVCVP